MCKKISGLSLLQPAFFILLGWILLPTGHAQQPYDMQQLLSLSLEELSTIKINSVSKQEEDLSDAPASIYVITRDDIHNAGVTTIPEALRLAPNLQAARINSISYAISARGFNNLVSNKLLVLIDGRTVYTPLFSGVFWDQQDVLLADIERIEVISGPGATLWGSNAVNGVINIITRKATDTQGWLTVTNAGNTERGFNIRYGGAFGKNGYYRLYAKNLEIDGTQRATGTAALDAFERNQVGFRVDWHDTENEFTLQGDIYDGKTEDRGTVSGITIGAIEGSGENLLTRWKHHFANGTNMVMQAYWDHTERNDNILFQPEADIFDIEFHHDIPLDRHRILWGGGYRHARDEVESGFFATFVPDSRQLNWRNLFIQDKIQLGDNIEATFGIKGEENDFSGWEYLPSIRMAWKPSEQHLIWSALSRAVRAPSRFDRDVYFPAPPNSIVIGGPNFKSEVAQVLELGYRMQKNTLSYSITAFYHDWNKLRSGTSIPVELENKISGPAYGLETWLSYQATSNWRLSAGATRLEKDLRLAADSTDPVGVENDTLSNDSQYQLNLRSALTLSDFSRLDVSIRHIAELPHPEVPAYTVADAHYARQLRPNLEISLTLQNLFDRQYREFEELAIGSAHERSVLFRVVWASH